MAFSLPFEVINKEFTHYLTARVLVTAGIKMTTVLLGWYLYELTESELSLGILGLSEVIPAILFALPAGVKVDTSDKKKLLMRTMIAYMAVMGLLCFVTSSLGGSIFDKEYIEYTIYGLVALTGWIRAYYSPGSNAFIAQIVGADDLVHAATTNSMSWLIAAVTGSVLGGFLIGFMDISTAFLFVFGMIGLAIMVFSNISAKPIMYLKGKAKTWESVKEGLVFVFQQKALFGAMGLDMFAVLFGGAVALLPVFAKDILFIGKTEYGILYSATYIGNFLALLYFAKYPLQNKQGSKLLFSVAGFGFCILIFAISKSFIISFLALLASGLFDGVSMIVRATIFQLFVPDQMRGRVSSVNSIFINSSNELGQFESGVAASIMGTVPSVIFGGLMTLFVAGFAAIKVPSLKKLEY